MLDPRNDRSLYRQLTDLLRADINGGEYKPGTRIPSESKLMARYGVARNTVRQAMEVLRDEGLVITRHGRGSFVRGEDENDVPFRNWRDEVPPRAVPPPPTSRSSSSSPPSS